MICEQRVLLDNSPTPVTLARGLGPLSYDESQSWRVREIARMAEIAGHEMRWANAKWYDEVRMRGSGIPCGHLGARVAWEKHCRRIADVLLAESPEELEKPCAV